MITVIIKHGLLIMRKKKTIKKACSFHHVICTFGCFNKMLFSKTKPKGYGTNMNKICIRDGNKIIYQVTKNAKNVCERPSNPFGLIAVQKMALSRSNGSIFALRVGKSGIRTYNFRPLSQF